MISSSEISFILSGEYFPIDILGCYDIDRAKSFLRSAPRLSRPVPVAFWRTFSRHMGWRILTAGSGVDYAVPVIVATVNASRGKYLLIDGWHRIQKAADDYRDFIDGFYLTETETSKAFEASWRGHPGLLL